MILDEIVATKRVELSAQRKAFPLKDLRLRAESMPRTRDFEAALRGRSIALIAEIKKASPSKGLLRAHAEPRAIAEAYANNGASAISVLTDRQYFQGDLADLGAARLGCKAPFLRKDFIIDEYQVYESRMAQADAILLIARLLSDTQLRDYLSLARSLGLESLVEVHNEPEVERALIAGATIIGINNRNLADFTVDLGTTERLARLVPRDRLIVSESGISSSSDVERMSRAGVDAVLVGEALMRADDTAAMVRELAGVRKLK